jgi:hypothetical protein
VNRANRAEEKERLYHHSSGIITPEERGGRCVDRARWEEERFIQQCSSAVNEV